MAQSRSMETFLLLAIGTVLKWLSLKGFSPFARCHLNMPATSNPHFWQCCDFRGVDKFNNIILLCWFSLPLGARCFFPFHNNWTFLTKFGDWLWITKSEQSLYLWICIMSFRSLASYDFLNCYQFLWSVMFHCI
jgi:hypothetical protein